MSSVVIDSTRSRHVVGMFVGDEVSYLFAKDFVVLAFILVVDFGFDIEEIGPSLLAALPAMPLRRQLARL
jgi:hypothetical protein